VQRKSFTILEIRLFYAEREADFGRWGAGSNLAAYGGSSANDLCNVAPSLPQWDSTCGASGALATTAKESETHSRHFGRRAWYRGGDISWSSNAGLLRFFCLCKSLATSQLTILDWCFLSSRVKSSCICSPTNTASFDEGSGSFFCYSCSGSVQSLSSLSSRSSRSVRDDGKFRQTSLTIATELHHPHSFRIFYSTHDLQYKAQ
jgi:hypothetical protein